LGVRGIGAALLLSLVLGEPLRAAPQAPPSSARLYVRGSKSLTDVIEVVGKDLERRSRDGRPLLVVLVDPSPRPSDAVGAIGERLCELGDGLPGARILVAATNGSLPPSGKPQDLVGACESFSGNGQDGVRNLLASVRRAVKVYRSWTGPKDILLVAETGVCAEEELEETLLHLDRAKVRFSVVAGEAAFAQPWSWSPPLPPGFVLRLTGHPDMRRDTAYPACEAPFPDTPAGWDAGLARTTYRLTPEHRPFGSWFKLPSGFGYYHLARLCQQTGGRYFMYGYEKGRGRLNLGYDYGTLRLFEPDLRSRAEIMAGLARHPLASVLFKVWRRLAEPRCGVISRAPPIGPGKPGGRPRSLEEVPSRPDRPVKLRFVSESEASAVRDTLRRRREHVAWALSELDGAEREYRIGTRGRVEPGDRRWMAQVDLMRLQLLRVRFHLGELLASLEDLSDADFDGNVIQLRPRTIYRGTTLVPGAAIPDEPEQIEALDGAIREMEHLQGTYRGTPWGLAATLGELSTWVIVIQPESGSKPQVRPRSRGGRTGTPARKPPRPSSGGGGTTTGGD
jgi:hypothetical protein